MNKNENNFGSEIGCVLWFDQKKGYGFIKNITPNSENNGKEIFFHFTGINSVNTFKKVYPGEYVSFDIIDAEVATSSVNNSLLFKSLNFILFIFLFINE